MAAGKKFRIRGVAASAALFLFGSGVSAQPSIEWRVDKVDQPSVEVIGLDSTSLQKLRGLKENSPEWQNVFAIHVEQENIIAQVGLPAIIGKYVVGADRIEFQPQFAFQPGVRYRATARFPGAKPLTSVFHLPAPVLEAKTIVREVYPTAGAIPANLLKFYVHFSGPMSGGHIYEHIKLRTEDGKTVELPFLEIDEELWNQDMTRLTLFLDPGRIKRGVKPLEEVGPALEENKSYTLIIDSAWPDASGAPLKSKFEKQFRVGPEDREAPDPKAWKLEAPRAGTSDPVRITFPDPMDHALALRMIHIIAADGATVPCDKRLEQNEQGWLAFPKAPWKASNYKVLVQTTIEDLAGNNIGKPFEVDLFERVDRRLSQKSVELRLIIQ
jgi:hypothetical protein